MWNFVPDLNFDPNLDPEQIKWNNLQPGVKIRFIKDFFAWGVKVGSIKEISHEHDQIKYVKLDAGNYWQGMLYLDRKGYVNLNDIEIVSR